MFAIKHLLRPATVAGLFVFLAFIRPAYASPAQQLAADDFAQTRLWLKLLQYDEQGKSEVHNADFFFATNGNSNPVAELQATIAAFQNSPAAICRFPARHQALVSAQLADSYDYTECTTFQQWLRTDSVASITLVFADGYLKNPASFHGHLFLRLDSNRTGNGHLLDNSLNFGAVVPDDDDPVTYIVKGLFGGYQARYSAQPFYRHNLSYGEVELRNLWDYQLNLTAQQSQLLAAHLWELSHTDYQYYFTSKNCAYYVARAIEVVTRQNIVSSDEWTVLPTDILQRLQRSPEGLVRSISVSQSDQSLLQSQFHQLSAPEQDVVRAYIKTPQQRAELLATISAEQQKRILITLRSYYAFIERQGADEVNAKQEKARVLRALLALAPGNPLDTEISAAPPHSGQAANLLRVGYRHFEHEEAAATFTFRPSFYDRLQPSAGKLPHSALSMGEVEFLYQNQKLKLERLWLLNIEALNISNTGLPHDGGRSWMVRAGAERRRLRSPAPPLSAFVEGGIGHATQFGPVAPYAMLHGRVHSRESDSDDHYMTVGVRAGFDYSWRSVKGYCEIEQPIQVGSDWTSQHLISRCGASLYSHQGGDIRVQFAHQNEALADIAVSFYF